MANPIQISDKEAMKVTKSMNNQIKQIELHKPRWFGGMWLDIRGLTEKEIKDYFR